MSALPTSHTGRRSTVWLRQLAGGIGLQGLLLILGVISLCWNAIAFVLDPLLSGPRRAAVGRAGIAYGYRLFWWICRTSRIVQLDARALDALRHAPGGLIIVANHPSLLDALMLVSRLPRGVCIMKASLMGNIFLGAGARLADYIPNDSPRAMIRGAVQALAQGGQLIIFPEGTRTTQPPVNAFRPGFTLIAKLANAPIQTVFIDTDSPYLSKGWPLWRVPPMPVRFTARLGERFAPEADAEALLHRLEAYMARDVRVRRRLIP